MARCRSESPSLVEQGGRQVACHLHSARVVIQPVPAAAA
jgi:hypothetical protein